MVALVIAALLVSPWTGKDLPTASQAQAKYRLEVTGKPGDVVHLTVNGMKDGWIGAFCDGRVCSPNSVSETIPASGRTVVQFELIRETTKAAAHTDAVITGSDGSRSVVHA
jgi:hypothetical protein